MDEVVSNWTMEFLLQSFVPDSTIQKTLTTVLPHSTANSRLKIALLLRTLQTSLLNASLSETSLEILEHLENLYHNDAIPILDTMRSAYCAVAVENTVKYLITCPESPSGEYFFAVRRIWRERVCQLSEEGRRSELLSDELVQWKQEVEAALFDVGVSERLVGLNTRRDAMNEMKRFLKEAWGIIGLSFIDSMALVSDGEGLRPEGVCEIASGSEVSKNCDGMLEGLEKEKMNSVGDDEKDNKNENANDHGDHDGDVATMGENHGNEQLEERVGTSNDANQEVGGCDSSKEDKEIRKDNLQRKRNHSAIRTHNKGVRISGADEKDNKNENANANVNDDGDVATMGENHGNEQLEERVGTSNDANQEVGGCDSSKGDKEIRKDNLQRKRKHSAIRTHHKGVRISGAEEAKTTNLSCKCESLSSGEVKKVRESLKSSSMELKAMVKDPLPDALQASEVVRSKLASKDINHRSPIENQSGHVDVPDSTACKTIILYQPNDVNPGKKSSVHCSSSSSSRRPKLMERASSAHTFEWNDSIENLPLPKKKKRRWTSLEEETLRAGVKMFGEGSWSAIREFYSNIFEFRSAVDLKDKWRNLIR
ncbi:hypothetical protein TSUD_124790 [Trifolium subterraneum]|uniref:Uncharacterized protein n=1 Tax=Trifolium subterraneum TaxID=3900 RepID=A0A2Z6LQ20_TRISU|nr:hypothetical protein TSUD_124790 [Trifolium subterraneum]